MLVLRFCNVFGKLTTYVGWTLFLQRYSVENPGVHYAYNGKVTIEVY